MGKAFWVGLVAGLLAGCGTTPVTQVQHELVDQILKPRAGYPGKLTNRSCLVFDDGKCLKESILAHDLNDPQFRANANSLRFACKLADRHFKICLDKPGFCRFQEKACGFLGMDKCRKEIEYVPAEPYQFLIDSGVICFSEARYDWSVM